MFDALPADRLSAGLTPEVDLDGDGVPESVGVRAIVRTLANTPPARAVTPTHGLATAAQTIGRRLAIVGWIRSHVRDPGEREILFDLDRVVHEVRQNAGKDETVLNLLLKTRSNLLRRWAD